MYGRKTKIKLNETKRHYFVRLFTGVFENIFKMQKKDEAIRINEEYPSHLGFRDDILIFCCRSEELEACEELTLIILRETRINKGVKMNLND